MARGIRILIPAAVFTALACGIASAEKVFPVNDNNTGVFDQPSVALSGSVAHVAFIGDTAGTGYKVFYAAVNAAADFTNVNLVRDNTVILTPATIVDNTTPAYADARHPKIAVREASASQVKLVILFQARPTSTTDTAYRPYLARVTVANNVVTSVSVSEIAGITPGDVEDISFALVAADNTARIAYANRTSIAPTEPFQIFFARVGIDNATAVGAPVPITSGYPLSVGFRPVPSLGLDDLNRAHIAWAATDNTGTSPGPVYYAMVKETSGVDNLVIAPTPVMTRFPMRWSFPNLLVFNRSLITIVAADEVHGDLGYVQLNPDAARQNGLPAWDNLGINNNFLLVPPGEAILGTDSRLFRPEAIYEPLSGRMFLTGYGTSGGVFFAIKPNSTTGGADFVTLPTPFAVTEPPASIAGDYTKAAFAFPGGKVVVFWSGIVGAGNRNVDVTTVPTVAAFVNAQESGCFVAPASARPRTFPAEPALMLLLPAAVVAARRRAVRRRPGGDLRKGLGR